MVEEASELASNHQDSVISAKEKQESLRTLAQIDLNKDVDILHTEDEKDLNTSKIEMVSQQTEEASVNKHVQGSEPKLIPE